MKIAFFSTKSYDRESFNQFLPGSGHHISYFEVKLDKDTLSLAAGHEVVCSFVNDKIDAEILKELKKLEIKLIALRCAGYNQIDLNAAAEQEITVVRVPAYSPEAVAEHAFALILTLSRKTHKAYNRVRENNFSLDGLTGVNIHGKTIGVIGVGAIGRAFCRIAKGFGCQLIANDVYENEEMKTLGVTYHSLKKVLSRSDIVSLHCPLTPETHHMINAETISQMKDGVALINTSRGALVDTKAVIKALKTGKIGYLGIDVYEQEEHIFFKNLSEEIMQDEEISRLMTFPNVLITGHQAFLTKEALEQISKITLSNISDFEKGLKLKNEIKAT
ncbi:MAG: hydroxyacid dehydrogenase [Cyclobacterium sp.]|nr:hydroxyacid dehydrogenase [Cyclobacterium sp.]